MAQPGPSCQNCGSVVITGLGMVTPLGMDPPTIFHRLDEGRPGAARPAPFDASPFACPLCAWVEDFRPQDFVAETKLARLMNRDAQLAVAAARLAMRDAAVVPGRDYSPERMGIFGATGLAGLPPREVAPLVKASAGADGAFDPIRFGEAGLRSVSPILSFKILSNMPVCFVSICENIQGVNAVYTPWEGHGARAVEAGILALRCGDAQCVLVGGCDVKSHELAYLTLEQLGLFRSWREHGSGVVPGEGAAYLVIEHETAARKRGARIYARLAGWQFRCGDGWPTAETCGAVLGGFDARKPGVIIRAANGEPALERAEADALAEATHHGLAAIKMFAPKKLAGDLFAAAAALQLAVGALAAERHGTPVLVNCFGYGGEQAAFLLEPP